MTGDLLLRNAEVRGAGVGDLWVHEGLIADQPLGGAREIDCGGAALLPGLHDHHIHLLAAAAAAESVPCGPPEVTSAAELRSSLISATAYDGWVRGIGYDEVVAGDLDALALDALGCTTPVRIQHRGGAMWVVNTAGIEALALSGASVEGVERDGAGRPTGRLWRLDGWLRERLGESSFPDLATLSARLASFGIVGVTDATPDLPESATTMLAGDDVVQRLTLLGSARPIAGVERGPLKIVLGDHDLPTWNALAATIAAARPRAVALHSVTRASLFLVLAVIAEIGSVPGDRIEHAAVAPPEAIAAMAGLGLTVVTQPSLIRLRGASYLDRVEESDQPWLWPFQSLLDAGVRVGLSSDAPYGDPDPWSSIAAAVDRGTLDGRTVVASERVTAWQALRGYLTPAEDPGGPERRVAVGAAADLALLDRPLVDALAAPQDVQVRLTAVRGHIVHEARR